MEEMQKICVWPDGTWCHWDDIEEYSWKSDDYDLIQISEGLDEETVDELVHFMGQLTIFEGRQICLVCDNFVTDLWAICPICDCDLR